MLCLSWWSLLLIVVGAGVLGFVVHFVWRWWLLSRPDVKEKR